MKNRSWKECIIAMYCSFTHVEVGEATGPQQPATGPASAEGQNKQQEKTGQQINDTVIY